MPMLGAGTGCDSGKLVGAGVNPLLEDTPGVATKLDIDAFLLGSK